MCENMVFQVCFETSLLRILEQDTFHIDERSSIIACCFATTSFEYFVPKTLLRAEILAEGALVSH